MQITAGYILEHVEINCGFEIWHIKPFCNSHIFKGAILRDLTLSILVDFKTLGFASGFLKSTKILRLGH